VSALRLIGALLLAAAAAQALEVPAGAMPKIDGVVGADEWNGAAELKTTAGVARLRLAGRVLCIGLDFHQAYEGERIDLHVADAEGVNYTWHAFHPACATPDMPGYPMTPALVRRSSWLNRPEAPVEGTRQCLFRSRVYADKDAWSAEIAVDLTALDVSVVKSVRFRLDVAVPSKGASGFEFAPGGARPPEWTALEADWPDAGDGLRTEAEDERRAFELGVFLEFLGLASRGPVPEPVIGPAVAGRKNNEKIAAVLARVDDCLEADPADFFAGFVKIQLLRHANRPEEAWAALQVVAKRFPHLPEDKLPLAAERFNLLLLLGRFDEALEMPLPEKEQEYWREVLLQWQLEQFRWESAENLPRVAFKTDKGLIVAEIYPQCEEHVLTLVREGYFDGKVLGEVIGGRGARIDEEKPKRLGPVPKPARFAWRGTIALPFTKDNGNVGSQLMISTGMSLRGFAAVGRIVEGQEHADALEAGDKIESARVLKPK
jgi:hypothetical protein